MMLNNYSLMNLPFLYLNVRSQLNLRRSDTVNKQIINEIKSKDKIIEQLLHSLSNSFSNSELESKNNIIRKLIDQNNIDRNKHTIQHRHENNELVNIVNNQPDKNKCCSADDSLKNIKEHVEKIKKNGSPYKSKPNDDIKVKPTPKKKTRVEILGDSMLNGVQEKGMNKDSNINIKIQKYPGAISTDIKPY